MIPKTTNTSAGFGSLAELVLREVLGVAVVMRFLLSELGAQRCPLPVHVDAAAPEGVDPAPAPRDVEQLQMADACGKRGVDDEMVADRLEAEHRAQEQERRACRPGLRAAGRRVLHRVLRQRPLVAAERLRQAAVEELGGVEDARGDLRRLLLEAVASQAPGDEGVVERPDGADVVADRVVAALAFGQRAHAPAARRASGPSGAGDRLRLRLVDDAAPEQMAVVRGQRVDLLARRCRAPGRSTRRPRPRSRG